MAPTGSQALTGSHSGIVDEQVYLAKLFQGFSNQPSPVGGFGNIGLNDDPLPAQRSGLS